MQRNDKPSHVRNNEREKQFELQTDHGVAVAAYERRDGALVFTHTEVPAEARGEGVGDQLARAAFDHARAAGEKVVPKCPFMASWLRRHPEYEDLRA